MEQSKLGGHQFEDHRTVLDLAAQAAHAGGQNSTVIKPHRFPGRQTWRSDIIISARPTASDQASGAGVVDQHDVLIAHALAQASVLSVGLTRGEVAATGVSEELVPHKVMPGNRPVSVIMMDVLTPFALGALLAAYEHSVFVQASVWQINPFDQWGVELGKKVASGIVDDIHRRQVEDSELDPATQKSLAAYLARRDEGSS